VTWIDGTGICRVPRDGVNGALCFGAGPALTFCSRRVAEIERRSASGGSKAISGSGASDNAAYIRIVISSLAPRLALLKSAAIFLVLVFFPIGLSAGRYWLGESRSHWQTADRSSAGLLPLPSQHTEAIIRVYGARTVRWKAIFAIHTWIVVKEANASTYTRYDYTAWGEPIRTNGFAADARWFGAVPETITAVDGPEASRLIPKIRHVVENYKFRAYGDYNAWPGPNSNTFVQAVLDAVPELKTVLPPTAIGKDYPYRGAWFGLTPSGTGAYASAGGYLVLTIGWVEGLEINFLGAVLGLDIRRPALKLPGIGRLGLTAGI
jgi:Protein of unknown function (DUF3750)